MNHDGGPSPMYWVFWMVFQNGQTFPGFPGIPGVHELLQVILDGFWRDPNGFWVVWMYLGCNLDATGAVWMSDGHVSGQFQNILS